MPPWGHFRALGLRKVTFRAPASRQRPTCSFPNVLRWLEGPGRYLRIPIRSIETNVPGPTALKRSRFIHVSAFSPFGTLLGTVFDHFGASKGSFRLLWCPPRTVARPLQAPTHHRAQKNAPFGPRGSHIYPPGVLFRGLGLRKVTFRAHNDSEK